MLKIKTTHIMFGGDVVRSLPDATFGFNMYGDKWYFGAAIPQLLTIRLNLMDDDFLEYMTQFIVDG